VLERVWEGAGEGVRAYFVAVRQDVDEVAQHYYGRGMTYGVLVDGDGLVSTLYGVREVPTWVVIDGAGRVAYYGRSGEEAESETQSAKLKAQNRDRGLGARGHVPAVGRRFVVELDEDEGLSRRVSEAVRTQRGQAIERAARRVGARVVHGYGTWRNRVVVEVEPSRLARLRELPGYKRVKEDCRCGPCWRTVLIRCTRTMRGQRDKRAGGERLRGGYGDRLHASGPCQRRGQAD